MDNVLFFKHSSARVQEWELSKQFQIDDFFAINLIVFRRATSVTNTLANLTINFSSNRCEEIVLKSDTNNYDKINEYIDKYYQKNHIQYKIIVGFLLYTISTYEFPNDESNECSIDVSLLNQYFSSAILIPQINDNNRENVTKTIAEFMSENDLRKTVDIKSISREIEKLKNMIDNECDQESELQEWMERNIWAFGYKKILNSRSTDKNSDHQVDGFVTNNNYCDVIELKTASKGLFLFENKIQGSAEKCSKYWHPTKQLSEALGQINHYISDYKKNKHTTNAGKDSAKENIYFLNPKGILIIGTNKNKFKDIDTTNENEVKSAEYDFSNFNYMLHNIEIWTWDTVYEYASNLLNILESGKILKNHENN